MNTTMSVEGAAVSSTALRPRPDQETRWSTYQRPIAFDEAANVVLAAHHDDGRREDVIAHQLRTWAFGSSDGATMELMPVPFEGRLEGRPVALREHAFSQLCSKLGAPPSYIRGLPMRLQIACMNWGMVREQSPAMLRLADGEVRAILSDRYAAADDELLLEMVAEALDKTGFRRDALVRAVAVGPHTLMRITIPSEGDAVRPGDVIEHGIDIGNSELGMRSVGVTPITYRLVCTNGMRAWKSEGALRIRHIGDPQRLRAQLRDAIPVAFAEARGDLKRWERAVETLIASAAEEIEALRRFGLGSSEVQAVARTFANDQHLLPAKSSAESLGEILKVQTTAFDVANAVTATARDRADVAARLSLEEAAHRYLVHAVA